MTFTVPSSSCPRVDWRLPPKLLESLKVHDERVRAWRRSLAPAEETEIAASLGREYAADEWIGDEAMAEWIDALGTDHEASNPRHLPR